MLYRFLVWLVVLLCKDTGEAGDDWPYYRLGWKRFHIGWEPEIPMLDIVLYYQVCQWIDGRYQYTARRTFGRMFSK